jgi:hypothetical protein
MPDYLEDNFWKRTALMGGLGGAALPLLLYGGPQVAKSGWKGLLEPGPWEMNPPDAPPDAPAEAPALPKVANAVSDAPALDTLINDLELLYGFRWMPDARLLKAADDYSGSILHKIPVDEWGGLIEQDPYLTPPEKALAIGLPVAASATQRGSNWVSPMDVARVALGAGLGAAMGRGLGMIAGPIFGLTPKAREGIQRAGLLAGAVKSLFGFSQM